MTKLPTESQDIRPAAGPAYKVGPTCAVPFCNQFADHAHHLVRRSFLGGDYAWVVMPDGLVIGNLVGLCWLHHQAVTENRTQITYEDGVFYWDKHVGDPEPLVYQPPLPDYDRNIEDEDHDHVQPAGEDGPKICERCGQRLPKPKIETPPEEKKFRKTWAVSVPVDELEDGADTLDTLLEAARESLAQAGMEYGQGRKVKFYILSASLALFVQHSSAILSDQ